MRYATCTGNQRCPTFIISFFLMLVVYIDRRIRIIGRQPVLSKCHALETSTIRRLCLQLMQNVGPNAHVITEAIVLFWGCQMLQTFFCPTTCVSRNQNLQHKKQWYAIALHVCMLLLTTLRKGIIPFFLFSLSRKAWHSFAHGNFQTFTARQLNSYSAFCCV